MKAHNVYPVIDLQLFAEGGAGDGGTGTGTAAVSEGVAAPQTKAAKNPLASVKYGKQEDATVAASQQPAQPTADDRQAKFEEMIKGEFKDLYDARMKDALDKRFKSTKDTVDKYEALAPTIEMLAKKYGVKADDIAALNAAIEEDDSYYEDEAIEKGISVEQLKEIRKIEKENSQLRQQMQERNARENAAQQYAAWMNQANDLKNIYPSFDLRAELQNPQFVNLLRSNIDVRTAYEVMHKDEIIHAAMQFTAKKAEQKLTNKIIAGGARPTENGNSSQSAAIVKDRVSSLSKADREEIDRRVARGEKISF
ncbi:MAG: hypothetical protein IK954_02370 [Clostridia bacterium]|nr:hypothetical protein [Clostridia bacterium]